MGPLSRRACTDLWWKWCWKLLPNAILIQPTVLWHLHKVIIWQNNLAALLSKELIISIMLTKAKLNWYLLKYFQKEFHNFCWLRRFLLVPWSQGCWSNTAEPFHCWRHYRKMQQLPNSAWWVKDELILLEHEQKKITFLHAIEASNTMTKSHLSCMESLKRIFVFEGNGCNDQYEGVTANLCARVSSFPETYDDAQARCNLEGGQLLQVINQDIHVRRKTS